MKISTDEFFILFTFFIVFFLSLAITYKNDEFIGKNKVDVTNQNSNVEDIKEFLLSKIKTPFVNIDYEVKSGDTIQKILKKLNVRNYEIQTVINKYKKYSNLNKLFKGNKIDIFIDVGAHHAESIKLFNNNFVVKQFFCFEASPINFQILKKM